MGTSRHTKVMNILCPSTLCWVSNGNIETTFFEIWSKLSWKWNTKTGVFLLLCCWLRTGLKHAQSRHFLFKVNNGNNRRTWEICSKLRVQQRHQNDVIDVFIVNFELLYFYRWLLTSQCRLGLITQPNFNFNKTFIYFQYIFNADNGHVSLDYPSWQLRVQS